MKRKKRSCQFPAESRYCLREESADVLTLKIPLSGGWDGTIEVKRGGKLVLFSGAVVKFKNNGEIKVERRLFGRGKVSVVK